MLKLKNTPYSPLIKHLHHKEKQTRSSTSSSNINHDLKSSNNDSIFQNILKLSKTLFKNYQHTLRKSSGITFDLQTTKSLSKLFLNFITINYKQKMSLDQRKTRLRNDLYLFYQDRLKTLYKERKTASNFKCVFDGNTRPEYQNSEQCRQQILGSISNTSLKSSIVDFDAIERLNLNGRKLLALNSLENKKVVSSIFLNRFYRAGFRYRLNKLGHYTNTHLPCLPLPQPSKQSQTQAPKIRLTSLNIVIIHCLIAFILRSTFGPQPICSHRTLLLPLTAVFLGSSLSILNRAGDQMMIAKTPITPRRPTLCLIRTGVFSQTRNPIYLSVLGFLSSISFSTNNLYMLSLMIPTFLWIQNGLIMAEERYLRHRFGHHYLQYCKKVPRQFNASSLQSYFSQYLKKKSVRRKTLVRGKLKRQ